MSIDLNLALTLFLGATWVALLNTIISTTRETPTEHSLIIVAFMHFIVLVYFILAAAVLYGRAVKTVTGREWSRVSGYEEILVVTWPAALLSALIGYLGARLTGLVDPLLMIIPFLGIALWLLIWAKKTNHLQFLVVIPVLFFPYLFSMAIIFCGVSVTTDKQIYRHGDTLVITARSQGYVFNPSIDQIQVWAGSYPTHAISDKLITGYARLAQPITTDMAAEVLATNRTYIEVVYTPQAWWFSRKEYAEITIIP